MFGVETLGDESHLQQGVPGFAMSSCPKKSLKGLSPNSELAQKSELLFWMSAGRVHAGTSAAFEISAAATAAESTGLVAAAAWDERQIVKKVKGGSGCAKIYNDEGCE